MLASIPPAYVAPFERAWRNQELIRAVVRREFISRFRGSALGPLWAVLSPLIMLLTYTALFSITVPQLSAGMSVTDYASSIFIGLIVFNLFSELAYRAPMLLHEHVNFVKKSIFPSETIAWTATIRAFTYGGVAFGVYIVFRLADGGNHTLDHRADAAAHHSLRVVYSGRRLVPDGARRLHPRRRAYHGLDRAGADVRDADFLSARSDRADVELGRHVVAAQHRRRLYRDAARVALDGKIPNIFGYLAVVVVSYAVFLGGYQFFMRYKSVIVDVI